MSNAAMIEDTKKHSRQYWLTYFVTGVIVQTAGWGIIVYQIFSWLRNGVWNAISLESVLHSGGFFPPYSWYVQPDSWIGVHSALSFALQKIPLSLFLIALSGVACWHFGTKLDEQRAT